MRPVLSVLGRSCFSWAARIGITSGALLAHLAAKGLDWARSLTLLVAIIVGRRVGKLQGVLAAAVPAAWPMPIAVAVTRLEANASEVAEWQRPATNKLSIPKGSRVR
mgnify:CR=1 FL=1